MAVSSDMTHHPSLHLKKEDQRKAYEVHQPDAPNTSPSTRAGELWGATWDLAPDVGMGDEEANTGQSAGGTCQAAATAGVPTNWFSVQGWRHNSHRIHWVSSTMTVGAPSPSPRAGLMSWEKPQSLAHQGNGLKGQRPHPGKQTNTKPIINLKFIKYPWVPQPPVPGPLLGCEILHF